MMMQEISPIYLFLERVGRTAVVRRSSAASCDAEFAQFRRFAAGEDADVAEAAAAEQPPETTTATSGMRRCTTAATVEPACQVACRTAGQVT